MIRFIDLGHQIGLDETWPQQLAFFTTITDTFLEFGGYQVFHSWGNFEEHWKETHVSERTVFTLDRFRSLCPQWVFDVRGNPFDER